MLTVIWVMEPGHVYGYVLVYDSTIEYKDKHVLIAEIEANKGKYPGVHLCWFNEKRCIGVDGERAVFSNYQYTPEEAERFTNSKIRGILNIEKVVVNELRQESSDTQNDYKDSFSADFSPLSLLERDIDILRHLNNLSKEAGYEFGKVRIAGAALINGELHEFVSDTFTNNERGIVYIPPEISYLIDAAPERTVHIFHSHTNDTAFSPTDFWQLFRPSVDKTSVVAYNGTIYSVSVRDGVLPTLNEYEVEVKGIIKEVDAEINDLIDFEDASFDEDAVESRFYASSELQAFRIARHYKWTIERGSLNEQHI